MQTKARFDSKMNLEIPEYTKKKLLKIYQPGCETTIKINDDKPRSLPEMHFYWTILDSLSDNTPEYLEKQFGVITSKAWHELFKGKYGISSVAFINMKQDEFHAYFQSVIKDIEVMLGCTFEEMLGCLQ